MREGVLKVLIFGHTHDGCTWVRERLVIIVGNLYMIVLLKRDGERDSTGTLSAHDELCIVPLLFLWILRPLQKGIEHRSCGTP